MGDVSKKGVKYRMYYYLKYFYYMVFNQTLSIYLLSLKGSFSSTVEGLGPPLGG